MSKPRAKKRATPRKTPSAKTLPEASPETTAELSPEKPSDAGHDTLADVKLDASGVPAGANLLADIQQQCESLRTWHQSATAQLVARETQLDQFAKTLGTQQKHQTQEAQRLIDAQAQLEAGRQQITQLRAELDEEWASVRSLRKAQEKLGRELDAERTRINRDTFKFSKTVSKAA